MLKTMARLMAALFAIAAAGQALAHDYRVGDIEIGHPFTRATPPGVPTAAAYARFTNSGKTAAHLISARSDAAEKVEIHESTVENGIARMRPVPDGVVIAPGETVAFAPRSYHLMLLGLKQRFVEGEKVKLTLTFAAQGDVEVELAVEPIASDGHADH